MIQWFRPRGRVVRRRPLRSGNWITCDRGALPLWLACIPLMCARCQPWGAPPFGLEGVFV
nr:MAG TPA: hypothetical protein [Caudoviricetes sp.]